MVIGINIYYLSTSFVGWLIHGNVHLGGKIATGIFVFPVMAIYLISVVYLMLRKDKATILAREKVIGAVGDESAPPREDLAEIPFPE